MNKVIVGIVAGVALGAAATAIFLRHPGIAKEETPAEPAEESFVQTEPNGEAFVKLDHDTQVRMGLKTAPLAAAGLPPEVKGYGRVLDPTPLAALAAEGAAAQAALEASTQEFERVRLLHSQNQNASARELETAQAAMKRDRILVESVQARLLLGWGGAVASRPDLAALVHSLAGREAAIVRVDLRPGEDLKAAPMGGRVGPLAAPENLTPVEYLGPAPAADPQLQTGGFLFIMKASPLPPGTMLIAWLTIPGQIRSGVIVPRDALLRYQGEAFVYLQTGDDTFQREAVALGRPGEDGWFVEQGLKPQEKVVVVGAQELLSEELKGQGGGE